MARFLSSLHAAVKALPFWHVQLFERTTFALEKDALGAMTSEDKLILRPGDREAPKEGEGSTNKKQISVEERTLNACVNASAISTMFMGDEDNRKLVHIVTILGEPVLNWHTWQNKLLRNSEQSRTFLVETQCGGFFEHVNEIVRRFSSTSFVNDIGLLTTKPIGEDNEFHGVAVSEDALADTAGGFCFSLIARRVQRQLWLLSGWPWSISKVLKNDVFAEHTAKLFKADWAIYDSIEALPDKDAGLVDYCRRHLFNLTANIQIKLGLAETKGPPSEKFKDLIGKKSKGIKSSQIAEDLIGHIKNHKVELASADYRTPEKCYAMGIAAHVPDTRHKYEPLDSSVIRLPKTARLPGEAFQMPRTMASVNLSKMASTQDKADWYSPANTAVCTPVADLFVLRSLSNIGSFMKQASVGKETCATSTIG